MSLSLGTEKRIATFARASAKIVLELRREGDREGAARFEAVAIEVVESMRKAPRAQCLPIRVLGVS